MMRNRYISEGQLLREQMLMQRSDIYLERAQSQIDSLARYQMPTAVARLEAAVRRAELELRFQEIRLKRRTFQMEQFQKQVERCTIRAPHDGFVVYANDRDDDPRIELGSTVYQKMDLFFLPDLGNMEVTAFLNESVIARVAPGMPASVRIEALPQYRIEGLVASVSPLPAPKTSWRASDDVKNFLARIRLNSTPQGLLPGMSAQVEILTESRPKALVVPNTAVTYDDGQAFCYVAAGDAVQRRPVNAAPATPDLLEVTAGLAEGEQVVTDPDAITPDIPVVDLTLLAPTPSIASREEEGLSGL
jgi:HlyD family secretion protein